MFGFSRYQWIVIAAAWLGWGFDVFDAILFNLVAPNCIPTLLHLVPGSVEATAQTRVWTGVFSSTLLIGWALGGVLFGLVADRFGRRRTLLMTILVYSTGTALCAFVGDVWQLFVCRALASLGIGGEWAVGAALVAESVPDSKRVQAAVILQSSSPLGFALAGLVNFLVAGVWFAGEPETSWRYVFLFGLVPGAFAVLMRFWLHESSRFTGSSTSSLATIRALWSRDLRARTLSGLFAAVAGLLAWWCCTSFLPLLTTSLAQDYGAASGLDAAATRALAESWKFAATNWFNVGGLVGTFLALLLARRFGRRALFATYFLISLVAILIDFGADLAPGTRVFGYFFIGLGAYGVFAGYVFYLPELFPTRVRATGAGLTYNLGRVLVAAGPFVVGFVSGSSSEALLQTLMWVAAIPFIAAIGTRWMVETKDQPLPD